MLNLFWSLQAFFFSRWRYKPDCPRQTVTMKEEEEGMQRLVVGGGRSMLMTQFDNRVTHYAFDKPRHGDYKDDLRILLAQSFICNP